MDRSLGHQVFVAIGAFVAGSLGATLSVFVLCLAWLVPATRPAPPKPAVDITRRLAGHGRKMSRQESASSSESAPASGPDARTQSASPTQRPHAPPRHVSFHEPLSPAQIAHARAATSPASRSRSSSPHLPPCAHGPACKRFCPSPSSQSSTLAPSSPHKYHPLTPIPSADPSPLSSDETLTEPGHPSSSPSPASAPVPAPAPARASLDSDDTDSELPTKRKHRLSLLGHLRARKHSHPSASTSAPAADAPLARSATVSGGDHRPAGEFGELAHALEQGASQAETARERGRFGWRLRRSRTVVASASPSQSPPQAKTGKGRWGSRRSSIEPNSLLVDLAEAAVPAIVVTDMPRSASPEPIVRPPALPSSASRPSSTDARARCRLSRSPPPYADAPLPPSTAAAAAASPRKKSVRRKASKEKEDRPPPRTQPYGPPYNVPPPDAGEWGVPCAVALAEGVVDARALVGDAM